MLDYIALDVDYHYWLEMISVQACVFGSQCLFERIWRSFRRSLGSYLFIRFGNVLVSIWCYLLGVSKEAEECAIFDFTGEDDNCAIIII